MLELPTIQAVNDVRVARFKEQITETLAAGELEGFAAIVEDYERENNVPALEIAAALAKMTRRGVPLLLSKPARESPQAGEAPASGSHRPAAEKPPAGGNRVFRVEVGSAHGVKPGNLVGAIANESGLDAKHIGRIEVLDGHSLIELPAGIPRKILAHLQTVQVAGRALRIREGGEMPPLRGGRQDPGVAPRARRSAAGRTRADAKLAPRRKDPRVPSRASSKPERKKNKAR